MNFKKPLISVLLTCGIAQVAQAAQIISPFAADLSADSYTQSSFYLSDIAQSAFNGGQWNAGDYGYHWIQADMGSTQTLTEIKITIAQSPNGYTEHKIYLSDTPIGNDYGSLTAIYSHAGSTVTGDVLDVLLGAPQSGRYLEIVSYGGSSWTALGDKAGRTNWEQPAVSAVPVPAAVWLFGSGFLSLAGIARRRSHK